MAVIEGHGFRQLNYSAFRRCVGRAVASGHKPEYRCHIDDRTAPSFSHVRQRATRQQPDGTNVHIKSLIPLLLSNLLRGPDMESTRIVQQKVQSAELFQRTVNETSNFASFGNVGGNRKRRLADLAHEVRERLEVEPDGTAELAEIKPGAELPSIADVEGRLERIHRERERLGAVNLLAEQELREVEEQHVKLCSERDDLVEAIRRLRQGVLSLNSEARERLLSSFTTVNENFKKLFGELFGGGNAELQLIESEDPLEAGLEIMAKPPGKKPTTLSLLSGGEQALTALALIFAVFLTNPAPICVLDEVDAPLDDYNVERFCDLLDEMTRSTDTRFIIITHNPITMARMNRLYGVTMAERGVSQLVSVDLEGAVKLREAS